MKFSITRRLLSALLPLYVSTAFGQTNLQLACDSISASKSKCGFSEYFGFQSDPPRIYLRETYTTNLHDHEDGCPGFAFTYTYDLDFTFVDHVDAATCAGDPTQCSGSGLFDQIRNFGYIGHYTCDYACDPEGGVQVTRNTPSCAYSCDNTQILTCGEGDFGCPVFFEYDHNCPPNSATTKYCHYEDDFHDDTFSATLSDEYTTAMLISNTIAALPPYPGTFTGTCSAYRNLSSNEATLTIRRFRYKFTFSAAQEPFVIHWIERFTPDGGGPSTDTPKSETQDIGDTESNVFEVSEPSSNGTVTIECVGTIEVESASIRDGEFVITVPALDCSDATGTLDLILKREDSEDQIVLNTLENQQPGTVTVLLDDIMDTDVSPLDGQDGIVFDRVAVRWRIGEFDVTSADRNLDVPVEVLSQRTISNYFSPTWDGSWRGRHLTKGVYPAGQFPSGLYNADRQAEFLDALDEKNEGLAMDGNTVIRLHDQPVQPGFPPVEFLPRGSGRYGYIEFPDRRQSNTASGSTVRFLRTTSVAVRPNADRLSYRTADEVYVPSFGVRTVDDAGGLHGNTHQIDIWIGQGDSALRAQADDFGIRHRTCLKLLNQ